MSLHFIRENSIQTVVADTSDLSKIAGESVDCILKSISSTRMCYPDSFLESWTENKTTKNCMDWFLNPLNDTFLYVGRNNDVRGVLLIQNQKNILLFYVHPDFMGGGIGGRLLDAALETLLPKKLCTNATLNSVNWYLSKGFKLMGNMNIEGNILADIPLAFISSCSS